MDVLIFKYLPWIHEYSIGSNHLCKYNYINMFLNNIITVINNSIYLYVCATLFPHNVTLHISYNL